MTVTNQRRVRFFIPSHLSVGGEVGTVPLAKSPVGRLRRALDKTKRAPGRQRCGLEFQHVGLAEALELTLRHFHRLRGLPRCSRASPYPTRTCSRIPHTSASRASLFMRSSAGSREARDGTKRAFPTAA